tara:strand:- start:184 stop:312 length:129 start_codon:yes stop_codon:yes gene_type:complete
MGINPAFLFIWVLYDVKDALLKHGVFLETVGRQKMSIALNRL